MTTTRTRRHRLKLWHRKKRYAIRLNKHLDRTYRVGVAVVGALMILLGVVMIPLPTPGFGWLTLFLGLGVLSTEFEWAHRVTHLIRRGYDAVLHWYLRRSAVSKTAMACGLIAVVLVGSWATGLLGMTGQWVSVDAAWLQGPLRG
ncbi:TIGR02611 family protein [Tomitella biformata]|uniref:TIGR02611 family protein n=1 Tax=Tomitella biformata TaxID=630403 RepID=UPI000466AB18|nr:TIGR02611 family protein [Tomitella biformata]